MTYIDTAFYKQFTGEEAPEGFDSLVTIASLMIDTLCGGKVGDDLSRFPEAIQKKIKQATASQLTYLESVGGLKAVATASAGKATTASIGKFSYSDGERASAELMQGIGISPLAMLALSFTGLLYRGVDVWR